MPLSKATLVRVRAKIIAKGLDRRPIGRTLEMAEKHCGVSRRHLRAALDSSPLWGEGRGEDTYNLLGHALRKALDVIARHQGRGLGDIAAEARVPMLGASSLKSALDLNWDDPVDRNQALGMVLGAMEAVEHFRDEHPAIPNYAKGPESLAIAQQVKDQDVETAPSGEVKLRQGVAKDRRISVEDGEMRHGRKSRSQRVDGYKRHILRDLDSGLVRAVGITLANVPEATVTEDILADLKHRAVILKEAHIDRAYLTSSLVRTRSEETVIYCKAWPVRNGDRFPKTAFVLDWDKGTIRCPNEVTVPIQTGGVVHFPPEDCAACQQRERCTRSEKQGRSVSIHPDERLLAELRERR